MDRPTNHFADVIELLGDRLKKSPPQVQLHSWWWKKWFSRYRKQREAMQSLIDWSWEYGGGYEEFERLSKALGNDTRRWAEEQSLGRFAIAPIVDNPGDKVQE